MDQADALEGAPIVQRMMTQLLLTVPGSGALGADARAQISDVKTNAYIWLRSDQLGPPLNQAFVLAQQTGATFQQIEHVRRSVELETPSTVGGNLVKNSGTELCLATQSEIVANMTFVSRQDVDVIKTAIQTPFQEAIETAADDMDQEAFQNITALYGALTNHLVTTARPLPRLIGYQFAKIMPSLVLAQRLYADASRADELVQENKVVHPAFMPMSGKALSA